MIAVHRIEPAPPSRHLSARPDSHLVIQSFRHVRPFEESGKWVGGWFGWIEEEEAVRMSYCGLCMGGWVGRLSLFSPSRHLSARSDSHLVIQSFRQVRPFEESGTFHPPTHPPTHSPMERGERGGSNELLCVFVWVP